jgi:hypothetical protein
MTAQRSTQDARTAPLSIAGPFMAPCGLVPKNDFAERLKWANEPGFWGTLLERALETTRTSPACVS